MARQITVRRGDCLINISAAEGFFWRTVWQHPENSELRQRRKSHNVLKEGDRLYIPDRQLKTLTAETTKRHTFVRRGVPASFTLILNDLGRPRADVAYVLYLDGGSSREGTTDAQGKLQERIPPGVQQGRLILTATAEEFEIRFGHIDPIDEITGIQTRLWNLGFYEADVDGELNAETVAAIAEFQRFHDLPGEGELTDATKHKLVEENGS